MSRSRSLAMVVAAALTAALAPAALASAAAPAKTDHAKAEHDRIVEYWTPERMKAAEPRDFVRQKDGSFVAASPSAAKGKPSGGGTTATCPTSVGDAPTSSGMSWECPGAVKRLTGKVFFTVGRSTYVCSGAVADDGAGSNRRGLVLTAGHCAWDLATKGFVKNWIFIPDYDSSPTSTCGSTQYGCWTYEALVVHSKFAAESTFNDTAINHDFAFAVVGEGGGGKKGAGPELDVALDGEYPVVTNSGPSTQFSALGYPQAKPYSGSDLVYCGGNPFDDPNTSNATWGLACKMTGGASGGPWLSGLKSDGSGGQLVSLNSYKYTGQAGYMYGPKFNQSTAEVYAAARTLASQVGISDSKAPLPASIP